MKLTYKPLSLEGIITQNEAQYAHLKQHISVLKPYKSVDEEEVLMGFKDGSCVREVYYRIPARTTREDFELFLQSYPNARIIRVLDHEAILSNKQRERVESSVISVADIAKTQLIVEPTGRVYIDRFGLAVYGQNRLSLSGDLTDQDNRWPQNDSGVELDDHEPEKTTIGQQLIERRTHNEHH